MERGGEHELVDGRVAVELNVFNRAAKELSVFRWLIYI